MERHKKEECPRRQYECPHCKEVGEYQERTTTHYDKCPKVKLQCLNKGCLDIILRCELSKHKSTCSYERVPCKYVNIGCKKAVLRKDLTEHENDSQHHLCLAIDAVNLLQTKYTVLASKTDQLVSPKITFKFTKFLKHKTSNDVIYSPPFYTSYGGYKMCIRVDANGNGDSKGTHVAVFTYLMCGENDDDLSWPYTGTVTIELLNQLGNRNHYSLSTRFVSDHGQRVVNHNFSAPGHGYGHRKYILHSSLDYDPIINCQYLKDDCLYFRLRATNPRQWLVTTGNF